MIRPATLYEILTVKRSASKDQIKKHYHKMSLLTHLNAGGDEEFFKTINRIDEAEKVLNNKTDN